MPIFVVPTDNIGATVMSWDTYGPVRHGASDLAAGPQQDDVELDIVPVLLAEDPFVADSLGTGDMRFEDARAVVTPGVTDRECRILPGAPS